MSEKSDWKMFRGANPVYWLDPGPLPPNGGRVPGQKYETRNGGKSNGGKGEGNSKGEGDGPPKDPWLEFWKAHWTEKWKQQEKEKEEMAKEKARKQNGTERGTTKGKEQERDPWMEYWKWKWMEQAKEEGKSQGKEQGRGKGKESVAPSKQNKNNNGKPTNGKSQHPDIPNANSFPAHLLPPTYLSTPPNNDYYYAMSYPYYPYGYQQGYMPQQGYYPQPGFVPNYMMQNPYASFGFQDPYVPGMNLNNEALGYANFDGYNVFSPGDHVKMHVLKSRTPPWDLEPYAEVPFVAANVPAATTLTKLLRGFGATNRDPHKNKCYEVHMGSGGRWYRGMVITGDDQLMMRKRLKDIGWDGTRDGLPGGKPIVCLYFTKG